MTVPPEYKRASEDFVAFLIDARDRAGLQTTNQSYTMVEGVLRTFRRRLSPRQALLVADVLPPVLRALFVADWNLDEPLLPFGHRADLVREVQTLRADHNFSPDTSIADVAWALRRHVDADAFDRALAALPSGAREFWRIDV